MTRLSIPAFALLAILITGESSCQDISFKNDVMPVFFRGGCNSGSCHGAARGKDGFKLSLFGFDPEGDYYRLTEEYIGRRVNLAAPEKSLLLEKVTGRVPHTGGAIFEVGDPYYETLRHWISEGAPRDSDDAAKPVRLELSPLRITFKKPGGTLQSRVIAHYDDGSERDVSALALYMTNNESVARIGKDAKIEGNQPGGTHVFARFDRFTVGTEVVVLPEGDFDWPDVSAVGEIDRLVFAKLKDLRIIPSELSTDEQFLRRVTIDLIGQLPTPQDYRDFIEDDSIDKRAVLVDRLLDREEFGEVWAAQWGEWLKINTDTNPGSGTAMKAGWNYYHWLRDAMVDRMPWDELAYKLLTGNGSNFRNPASNYYTMLPQGKVDPLKLGEDTAQIFLGLRTQCAQCHNHPFDRWTIDDYYGFTSFFTGVRRKHGSEAREYYTYVDIEAPLAQHPVDSRPMPHAFLGAGTADVEGKDPRKVLAQWTCSPNNKLFRRNLANRLWAHFFGRGIVHPVDDVRISNPPSNEPLLEELGCRLAEDYGFDARRLVRDIVLSRTYQLSPSTNDSNRSDEVQFSHAYLRRTRSDVLFDCLCQALEIKPTFRRSTAERALVMFEGGSNDNFNSYFFSTFGQAKRESVCTCETLTEASLSQALHLINGKTVDDAFSRNPVLVPTLMNDFDSSRPVIEALYVRILTRMPTPEELSSILNLDPNSKDRRVMQKFYDSVAWSLVNSSEFLFNH